MAEVRLDMWKFNNSTNTKSWQGFRKFYWKTFNTVMKIDNFVYPQFINL